MSWTRLRTNATVHPKLSPSSKILQTWFRSGGQQQWEDPLAAPAHDAAAPAARWWALPWTYGDCNVWLPREHTHALLQPKCPVIVRVADAVDASRHDIQSCRRSKVEMIGRPRQQENTTQDRGTVRWRDEFLSTNNSIFESGLPPKSGMLCAMLRRQWLLLMAPTPPSSTLLVSYNRQRARAVGDVWVGF